MTSLRMRVVEAVAEELEADCNAEAALDAMLDCLAEDAESSKSVRHLVRVLRETDPPTEEE